MRISAMAPGIFLVATVVGLSGCLTDKDKDPPNPPDEVTESTVDTLSPPAAIAWQNPLPQVNTLYDIHFPTTTTGYFVGQAGVVLKTTDGGKTFSQERAALGQLNAVRFLDADRGIAVGDLGLIISTIDGGRNWKTQYIGSSTLWGLCTHASGTALAVGDLGTILKSTDGGTTWILKNSGITGSLADCRFLDAEAAVATSTALLLRTTNGGDTWKGDSVLDQHGNKSDMLLHKLHFIGSGVGYALNYAAPVRTEDSGKSWEPWRGPEFYDYPNDIRDMAFTGAGSVILVGVGGQIVKRNTDIGSPWITKAPISPSTLLAAHFPVPDTGYAAGEYGEILRSEDGGDSWKPCGKVKTRENLMSVHFSDARNGFAVGSKGAILKTGNGGEEWNLVEGAASRDLNDVHFISGTVGSVVGVGGTALWTTDGGLSWSLGGTGTTVDLTAVRLIDAATAYAAGGLTVIRTRDGGKTWTQVPLPGQDYTQGWDIGDGLFYDGARIRDASDNLTFSRDCQCLRTRSGPGSDWKTHVFKGLWVKPSTFTRADDTSFYSVGDATLLRLNPKNKSLRVQNTGIGQTLGSIHCPEAGTCFAVGHQGVILKITPP